jgi:chemotaxis protein methyltransferase CheR
MSNFQGLAEWEVDEVLHLIKKLYGYDFTEYSRASITRRVARFMEEYNYTSLPSLLTALKEDRKVFVSFLEKITVNVTEMFRDPEFYRAFKEKVIPRLASYPIIKIWHAGCSSGEEIFSMAILLHEAGLLTRTRFYATDINPANLEKAKKGIMPLQVMRDYTTNYIKAGGVNDFASYYTAKYNNAIISKEFRDRITFSEHNLVTDSAFNEFQFICCRNVMIYFSRELQDRVIHLFHESLATLGYLALGIKESLLFSSMRQNFEAVSAKAKIFRRIN